MSAERHEKAVEKVSDEAVEDETSEAKPEPQDAESADPARQLAAAEATATDNWERYLRAVAEADNVRKRASRDVENAHKFALERFARELLAVTDGLEMALAASDKVTVESLLEGSQATLTLLGSTMERFGISAIDPEGEPFDPELHEAISVQPSDTVEPGTVVSVVQKGYALNGRLLRPAMVIVAET